MEHSTIVIRLFVVLTTLLSWSDAGGPTVKVKVESPSVESSLNVYTAGSSRFELKVGIPQANERRQRIETHEQFEVLELPNGSVVVIYSSEKIFYRAKADEVPHESYDETHDSNDEYFNVNKILSRGQFRRVSTLQSMLNKESSLGPKLMETLLQYGESIKTARRQPALEPLNNLLLTTKVDLDKNIGVSKEDELFPGVFEGTQAHDTLKSDVNEQFPKITLRVIETSRRLTKQNKIIAEIYQELKNPQGTLNQTEDGLLNEILRRVKQLMVPDSKYPAPALKRATSFGSIARLFRSRSVSSTSPTSTPAPPSSSSLQAPSPKRASTA